MNNYCMRNVIQKSLLLLKRGTKLNIKITKAKNKELSDDK